METQRGTMGPQADALEAGPFGLVLVLGFAGLCFAAGWWFQILIDHLAAR